MPAIQYNSPKHTCAFVTAILHIIPKGGSIIILHRQAWHEKRLFIKENTWGYLLFREILLVCHLHCLEAENSGKSFLRKCYTAFEQEEALYRKQMRGTNNTWTVVPPLGQSSVSQLSLWKDDMSQVLS